MLQQKIARLASDFASQLIGVLTAGPLEELVQFTRPVASRPLAEKKAVTPTSKTAPRKSAPKKAALKLPAQSAGPDLPNAQALRWREVTTAALEFFAERGTRGATAHQLGVHLTELGLASSADVVGALAKSGAVRDAGFRRAAGKNATAPVYVAA